MRNLMAIRPLVYASRRLQVGDYFTTRTERDAQILVAIGKAKAQRTPSKIGAPPQQLIQKVQQPRPHPLDHDANGKPGGSKAPDGDKDALNKLRAEYTDLIGKKPFAGWKAEELQRRIDEALAS